MDGLPRIRQSANPCTEECYVHRQTTMPVKVKTEDVPEEIPSNSASFPAKTFEDDKGSPADDPVVREINVFLSPELCQQLYLFQYPLQHTEVGPLTGARIKVRHGMVELDQPLPHLPKRHFEMGEQSLAYVTQRTFRSHTIPVETHMCLAKIKEEKGASNDESSERTALHMIPLQHIIQMRPSLQHIDADQNSREVDKPVEIDNPDGDGEKKPLMFKRKESERATHARKSSYAYKKASEDAEEWQPLNIFDEDSMEHHGAMDIVSCDSPNQLVLASPDLSKTGGKRPQYIESLNYIPLSRQDPYDVGAIVDTTNVKSVLIRLVALLRNGWPIPFTVLKDRFVGSKNGELNDDILFQALAVCAVMVRGNFCLHSRFVALPRPLQHARTFILLILQTKGFIKRERLQKLFEGSQTVTSDKLHVLLNQVAKRTVKGWELRVDDDLVFVSLYPEESVLHHHFWEQQSQCTYFRELLQKYDEV